VPGCRLKRRIGYNADRPFPTTGDAVADATPLEQRLLGQTLAGKYKLIQVQGGGYYSVVFVAHQYFCNRLVRPVAVKVSRQTGLTEETAPELFGDALILAKLLVGSDHEGRRHLVQIHDMGLLPEHDGRAFLVMEYVDGLPLLSHMKAAGRFSAAAGLRWMKQMCRALALVHGQGAIHRDLIPENILVDRRGMVRVVDFGLAAYADPRLGFVPGATGTFVYMAPETLRGRSTAASDVYSLGLVMYQLFTGGGPHLTAPWAADDKKDTSEENYRLKTALRFPPPSALQNEIRNDYRWLDPLILRCLAPDPADRFPDAAQLLAAVEACESGEEPPPLPARRGSEDATPTPTPVQAPAVDEVLEGRLREARQLLAKKAYDRAVDLLDVHRPAEWAAIGPGEARTLRLLGQAYLGRGDLAAARDCLEQLRSAHREAAVLARSDYAAVLSDLVKCYRAQGQADLAHERQEEARQLL
jgi:serine/threonine-protein kinase